MNEHLFVLGERLSGNRIYGGKQGSHKSGRGMRDDYLGVDEESEAKGEIELGRCKGNPKTNGKSKPGIYKAGTECVTYSHGRCPEVELRGCKCSRLAGFQDIHPIFLDARLGTTTSPTLCFAIELPTADLPINYSATSCR